MGISWRPYISAIVRPIAPHIEIPDDKLTTSQVSEERMSAAKILEGMDFDFALPGFMDRDGFILTLRTESGHRFVVLYRTHTAGPLPVAVQKYAEQVGLQVEQPIDAFVLFLLKNLEVPLGFMPPSEELRLSLKLNQKAHIFEIDFDESLFLYGNFAIWRVSENVSQENLITLFSTRDDGYTVSFDEKFSDFGIAKYAGNRFFNLGHFIFYAFNPIFVLTDEVPVDGSVKFEDSLILCEAVKLAQAGLDNVVLGPQSRSYFEYSEEGNDILCLPLSGLRADEVNLAIGYLAETGANQIALSSSHILSFSYLLQNSFLPSARFISSPGEIINALDLKKSIFIEVQQILELYDEYFIYDISQVSDFSKWNLLCQFSLKFPSLRSPFIGRSIVEVADKLASYNNSPSENIYLSLSASHWKHSFLEIYRVIEGLYYFGWMHKLKGALGSPLNEYSLFEKCAKESSWSYSEPTSIMALFELIPVETFDKCDISTIKCLKGRFDKAEGADLCRSLASAVYSIRNSHVHQGLRGTEKPIYPTGSCWESLTLTLYLAAEYLYRHHTLGMPPRVQK